MSRIHALAATLLVAVAAVAGVLALRSTVALGQSSKATPAATIARRTAALDRAETQIARMRASRPPALPSAADTTVQQAAPRVVYVHATAPAASSGETEHSGDHEDGHDGPDGQGWDD